MKTRLALFVPVIAAAAWSAVAADPPPVPELVGVTRIWSRAPHNAFTDLIRFRDRWYCAFREGKAHVSGDGSLRIITSADGEVWTPVALFTRPDADLRDPKLAVTPNNRLMLTTAAAMHEQVPVRHQSLVWMSADGKEWGEPVKIGDPNFWLWRVTWNRGVAYSVGYSTTGDGFARLYASTDGERFRTHVDRFNDQGYPNESAILFLPDESALCLLRRDGKGANALLGVSRPPYRGWTWKDLGVRLGGPNAIQLPDGRIVAAGRLYDGRERTSLCWLDPAAGTLTEFLALPSGGDTSYPGLVYYDDLLWVSYYSSHEDKTSIYLAKVRFPQPRRNTPRAWD